jgi:hypothetical protein
LDYEMFRILFFGFNKTFMVSRKDAENFTQRCKGAKTQRSKDAKDFTQRRKGAKTQRISRKDAKEQRRKGFHAKTQRKNNLSI